MDQFNQLSEIIRKRRSIFPKMYNGSRIKDEIVWEILENANWAPTHRMTEPWRFKVFTQNALSNLSDYLSNYYKDNTSADQYSENKFEKTKRKALKSSHVIAICMKRDPKARIPEWEEIAAVSCAVMNMWLSCSAAGIGCYWSSPKSILNASSFLNLKEGERCMGLFYMGYFPPELEILSKRGNINEKVEWFSK